MVTVRRVEAALPERRQPKRLPEHGATVADPAAKPAAEPPPGCTPSPSPQTPQPAHGAGQSPHRRTAPRSSRSDEPRPGTRRSHRTQTRHETGRSIRPTRSRSSLVSCRSLSLIPCSYRPHSVSYDLGHHGQPSTAVGGRPEQDAVLVVSTRERATCVEDRLLDLSDSRSPGRVVEVVVIPFDPIEDHSRVPFLVCCTRGAKATPFGGPGSLSSPTRRRLSAHSHGLGHLHQRETAQNLR